MTAAGRERLRALLISYFRAFGEWTQEKVLRSRLSVESCGVLLRTENRELRTFL